MYQLDLFPTCDDDRINNLMRAIRLEQNYWSFHSIDKLEKAGRMYHVMSQTVAQCFERVIENECSVNSTSS
jgi:hypothetical protein